VYCSSTETPTRKTCGCLTSGGMTFGRRILKDLRKCGGEHRPGPAGRSKNPGHLRAINPASMIEEQIAELEGRMACFNYCNTGAQNCGTTREEMGHFVRRFQAQDALDALGGDGQRPGRVELGEGEEVAHACATHTPQCNLLTRCAQVCASTASRKCVRVTCATRRVQ
jgi:hypothetical protein